MSNCILQRHINHCNRAFSGWMTSQWMPILQCGKKYKCRIAFYMAKSISVELHFTKKSVTDWQTDRQTDKPPWKMLLASKICAITQQFFVGTFPHRKCVMTQHFFVRNVLGFFCIESVRWPNNCSEFCAMTQQVESKMCHDPTLCPPALHLGNLWPVPNPSLEILV